MNTETTGTTDIGPLLPPPKTRGAKFEGIAFSFCKATTLLLLISACGLKQFALPILAGATALFYVIAHLAGQTDTRCILKKGPIVAAFWIVIAIAALWFKA